MDHYYYLPLWPQAGHLYSLDFPLQPSQRQMRAFLHFGHEKLSEISPG
jgi:hypothetical protein